MTIDVLVTKTFTLQIIVDPGLIALAVLSLAVYAALKILQLKTFSPPIVGPARTSACSNADQNGDTGWSGPGGERNLSVQKISPSLDPKLKSGDSRDEFQKLLTRPPRTMNDLDLNVYSAQVEEVLPGPQKTLDAPDAKKGRKKRGGGKPMKKKTKGKGHRKLNTQVGLAEQQAWKIVRNDHELWRRVAREFDKISLQKYDKWRVRMKAEGKKTVACYMCRRQVPEDHTCPRPPPIDPAVVRKWWRNELAVLEAGVRLYLKSPLYDSGGKLVR